MMRRQEAALLRLKGPLQVLRRLRWGFLVFWRGDRCAVMLKREVYRRFGAHFPRFCRPDGSAYDEGQIINADLLRWACGAVSWVVFVLEDERVFRIRPVTWWDFARDNRLECPHLPGEVALPLDFFEEVT